MAVQRVAVEEQRHFGARLQGDGVAHRQLHAQLGQLRVGQLHQALAGLHRLAHPALGIGEHGNPGTFGTDLAAPEQLAGVIELGAFLLHAGSEQVEPGIDSASLKARCVLALSSASATPRARSATSAWALSVVASKRTSTSPMATVWLGLTRNSAITPSSGAATTRPARGTTSAGASTDWRTGTSNTSSNAPTTASKRRLGQRTRQGRAGRKASQAWA